MYPVRDGLYRIHVLRGTGMNHPTIRSLTFIYNALDALKLLYISITDLMESMHLSPVRLGREGLRVMINDLCADGLLVRSTRKAHNGRANVMVYGLTGKGKQMLALYFAYLSGEYDHLLPVAPGA